MRLAQLARKLAIRPIEIVEFLTKQQIVIDNDSNTRLEDEHVALVMQKFAPARAAEVAAELASEKEQEVEVEPAKEIVAEAEKTFEIQVKVESTTAPSESEKPEVIKAPKVELSGLKVLGKIELPEPKKKEPQPIGEQPTEQTPPAEGTPEITINREKPQLRNRKPQADRRNKTDQRPRVNPIALQREREALEAEKRRREKAEQDKEKRTQHYLKKVKVVAPTKSVRMVNEEVEEMKPLAPTPTTWWGKFMKWLNT